MTRRAARVVLAAIVGLAAIETVAATAAYRTAVDDADVRAAAEAIAALPAGEPVVLADPWLGPRLRTASPRLARLDATGAPDLRGAARVHVIGFSGRDWSEALDADLEDLAAPIREAVVELGALTLTTWTLPEAGTVLADLVGDALRLSIDVDGKPCSGRRTSKCGDARIRPALAEIGYRPRRCLLVEADDGAVVRLRYPDMALGTVLRGHVGVHDFNQRLRSDAPIAVTITVGEQTATLSAADAEGWRPFAVATEPGTADVVLEVVLAARGTWQREGYAPGKPHAACVELRSLQEGP